MAAWAGRGQCRGGLVVNCCACSRIARHCLLVECCAGQQAVNDCIESLQMLSASGCVFAVQRGPGTLLALQWLVSKLPGPLTAGLQASRAVCMHALLVTCKNARLVPTVTCFNVCSSEFVRCCH